MGGDTSVRLSLPLLLAASCFVQLAHFLFGLSTSRTQGRPGWKVGSPTGATRQSAEAGPRTKGFCETTLDFWDVD